MSQMFQDASSFEGKGLEYWDLSAAKNLKLLFGNASKMTNSKLCEWRDKIPKDASVDRMFQGAGLCNLSLSERKKNDPTLVVTTGKSGVGGSFCDPCGPNGILGEREIVKKREYSSGGVNLKWTSAWMIAVSVLAILF